MSSRRGHLVPDESPESASETTSQISLPPRDLPSEGHEVSTQDGLLLLGATSGSEPQSEEKSAFEEGAEAASLAESEENTKAGTAASAFPPALSAFQLPQASASGSQKEPLPSEIESGGGDGGSPVFRLLHWLGGSVLSFLVGFGAHLLLGIRSFAAIFSRQMEWREAFRQVVVFGVGSLVVLGATAALVGGILVVQAGLYVKRFGVHELVGWFVGFGVLREVGPLVAALVFSGRVGSRNAAEIAAMATRDQLEGLRALGIDLIPTVVAPRLIAMGVSLASLFLVGVIVSVTSAGASAWLLLDIDAWQFSRSFVERTELEDLGLGLAKSLAFAAAVALISCRAGMQAQGGAAAVGDAAKRAVVRAAMAIVVLDMVVARFFQL